MQERVFTGILDEDGDKICLGDGIKFLNTYGQVVFECGAYGIGFYDAIDWDFVREQIPIVTGCDNSLRACENDNFISFWEIMWNFNCEENLCSVVRITPAAKLINTAEAFNTHPPTKQPTIIPEALKEYAEQMGMQEGKDFIVNKCHTGA